MRKAMTALVLAAAVTTGGCCHLQGPHRNARRIRGRAQRAADHSARLQPGAAGRRHRRPVAGRGAAAGDRRLVRRPGAAQPGRDQPARRRRPRRARRSASAARSWDPDTRHRRQGPDHGPDPDGGQHQHQRRLGPARPVRANERSRAAWQKQPSPPASSRSNRCSTARAAASRKASKLVEEAHKLLADIQQAMIGSPAHRVARGQRGSRVEAAREPQGKRQRNAGDACAAAACRSTRSSA